MLATVILWKAQTESSAQGDAKGVPNILFKIENDGAERLWSYILAYRRMMREERLPMDKESSKNNIISGLLPSMDLEQTQIVRAKNKNLKKPTST